MELDRSSLLDLVRTRDAQGVLSVYVGMDPAQEASGRPAWSIEVRNELRALVDHARAEGPHARWALLEQRIEGIETDLEALVDASEFGRGRALFAPVGGDEIVRVASELPFETRVVLDEAPYVLPLVAALDRGRPTGVVLVSAAGVSTLELRLGMLQELGSAEFEEETEDWPELKGPAAANPVRGQQVVSQRDRFQRRVDDERARFLATAAKEIAATAAERSWDRVVVAGDPALTEHVVPALGAGGRDVIRVGRLLETPPRAQLAAALQPELDEAERRRGLALVERARDAALAGGNGALGVGDTLTALAEGRVAHLLLAAGTDLRGTRSPDGRLLPTGVVPPGADASELSPEPLLAERMIEQALATDAAVTTVEGAAAGALAGSDGVAAILRW